MQAITHSANSLFNETTLRHINNNIAQGLASSNAAEKSAAAKTAWQLSILHSQQALPAGAEAARTLQLAQKAITETAVPTLNVADEHLGLMSETEAKERFAAFSSGDLHLPPEESLTLRRYVSNFSAGQSMLPALTAEERAWLDKQATLKQHDISNVAIAAAGPAAFIAATAKTMGAKPEIINKMLEVGMGLSVGITGAKINPKLPEISTEVQTEFIHGAHNHWQHYGQCWALSMGRDGHSVSKNNTALENASKVNAQTDTKAADTNASIPESITPATDQQIMRDLGAGAWPAVKPLRDLSNIGELAISPTPKGHNFSFRPIDSCKHYIFGNINNNGVLEYSIRAAANADRYGSGTELFTTMLSALRNHGLQVRQVNDVWGHRGNLTTNHQQFWQNIDAGMRPEQAAQHTFTGKRAVDLGLREVEFSQDSKTAIANGDRNAPLVPTFKPQDYGHGKPWQDYASRWIDAASASTTPNHQHKFGDYADIHYTQEPGAER